MTEIWGERGRAVEVLGYWGRERRPLPGKKRWSRKTSPTSLLSWQQGENLFVPNSSVVTLPAPDNLTIWQFDNLTTWHLDVLPSMFLPWHWAEPETSPSSWSPCCSHYALSSLQPCSRARCWGSRGWGTCTRDQFTKTFLWNFQKCRAVLCYILIDKQMLH